MDRLAHPSDHAAARWVSSPMDSERVGNGVRDVDVPGPGVWWKCGYGGTVAGVVTASKGRVGNASLHRWLNSG
jgi:hypothetical protein